MSSCIPVTLYVLQELKKCASKLAVNEHILVVIQQHGIWVTAKKLNLHAWNSLFISDLVFARKEYTFSERAKRYATLGWPMS
jgi:hypothetical protein